MKIQTTYPQPKPVKRLTLKKTSIRVLTQVEGVRPAPTEDCTLYTC